MISFIRDKTIQRTIKIHKTVFQVSPRLIFPVINDNSGIRQEQKPGDPGS